MQSLRDIFFAVHHLSVLRVTVHTNHRFRSLPSGSRTYTRIVTLLMSPRNQSVMSKPVSVSQLPDNLVAVDTRI